MDLDLGITRPAEHEYPSIRSLVTNVATICAKHDPDIDLDGLRIDVHAFKVGIGACGAAHSAICSQRDGRTRKHPAGLVVLRLNRYAGAADVVRVLAEELRHIGQYARERRRGRIELGIGDYLARPSEQDAKAFADAISDRYFRGESPISERT
jgi:hypothetical protein